MFPEGLYSGLRVGQGTGASANENKTPYIYVDFEIRHVAANGAWSPVPSPEKRTVKMYLSDGAWPTTIQKLESLGFKGDLKNPAFDEATAQQGVELRCFYEPYTNPTTGKTKNIEKWELEGWGGERGHNPIEADKLDVLTARYRQEKAATSAAPPPMAGAPAAPAGGMPGARPSTGVVNTSAGSFPTSHPGSPPGAGRAPSAAPPLTTSTPAGAPSGAGSGPPPMAPPPSQTRTRNEVWANATKAHADVPTDVMAMRWQKTLTELRPGKAEAAFTGEDWYAVECSLVAPF